MSMIVPPRERPMASNAAGGNLFADTIAAIQVASNANHANTSTATSSSTPGTVIRVSYFVERPDLTCWTGSIVRLDLIVINEYDAAWPSAFERERARIEPALRPWLFQDIEHMGSTAVPGLPAKAIIDMLAVVGDIEAAHNAIEPLKGVGWLHAPEPFDESDRRMSFCFPTIEHRTHHLHVVEERDEAWLGWLAFRDYLRAHDDVAADYAVLKQRLAAEHGRDPDERTAYRAGKSAFIRSIVDLALQEGSPGRDSS